MVSTKTFIQCEGPECQREKFSRDHTGRALCHTHYVQQWKGKPLTPIKAHRIKAPEGYAYCTGCNYMKPVDEFYWLHGKPRARCKACHIKRSNEIRNGKKESV